MFLIFPGLLSFGEQNLGLPTGRTKKKKKTYVVLSRRPKKSVWSFPLSEAVFNIALCDKPFGGATGNQIENDALSGKGFPSSEAVCTIALC